MLRHFKEVYHERKKSENKLMVQFWSILWAPWINHMSWNFIQVILFLIHTWMINNNKTYRGLWVRFFPKNPRVCAARSLHVTQGPHSGTLLWSLNHYKVFMLKTPQSRCPEGALHHWTGWQAISFTLQWAWLSPADAAGRNLLMGLFCFPSSQFGSFHWNLWRSFSVYVVALWGYLWKMQPDCISFLFLWL